MFLAIFRRSHFSNWLQSWCFLSFIYKTDPLKYKALSLASFFPHTLFGFYALFLLSIFYFVCEKKITKCNSFCLIIFLKFLWQSKNNCRGLIDHVLCSNTIIFRISTFRYTLFWKPTIYFQEINNNYTYRDQLYISCVCLKYPMCITVVLIFYRFKMHFCSAISILPEIYFVNFCIPRSLDNILGSFILPYLKKKGKNWQ